MTKRSRGQWQVIWWGRDILTKGAQRFAWAEKWPGERSWGYIFKCWQIGPVEVRHFATPRAVATAFQDAERKADA